MKKIDPNYLLDELNLQGDVIRRIAKLLGYPRESIAAGLYAAPRVTSQDHEVLEGLLAEMDERRMTRLKVEPRLTETKEPDGVDQIDELLDILRVLPSQRNMAAILSAHEIGQEARKRRIEQSLLHVAVSAGPRGVNMAASTISATVGRDVTGLDDLTEDELEKYYDSWMPRLPDGLREEWKAFVESTQEKWATMPIDSLARRYAHYLNEVLEAYACGTQNEVLGHREMSGLSRFNEIDPKTGYIKTRFWRHLAQVNPNPEFDGNKPWHAASQTVDGVAINPPFIIKITFEPAQLDELRKEGEIVVCRADELTFAPAGLGEYFINHGTAYIPGKFDGKIVEMLRGSKLWVAAVNGSGHWIGVGSTRMAALISLCAPQHMSQSEGRQMTDEEWSLLNQIASEKTARPEVGWTDGGKRKAVIEMAAEENEKAYRAKYADDLTPKIARFYYIHIKTSDNRKARWYFDSKMAQNERSRILAGLSELRNVFHGESSRDDEHNLYFVMPYTFEELTTVFGQFEELT